MKKILLVILLLVPILFLAYWLGPMPSFPAIKLDTVAPISIDQVMTEVEKRESKVEKMREGNAAEIVWADSTGKKTAYSIVYLHGFSASHEEGMPTHRDFAERYGCNLFLSRIDRHGEEDIDAFENLTPQELLDGTEFAIEIGKAIGEKVILMNCSTGSTAGLFLSAGDPDIVASFNYSPNIDIHGNADELLVGPWAKQIAKLVFKGNYNRIQYSEEQAKYWYDTYHVNGLISLKWLINETMTKETFEKITHPTFLAYYYKNEEEQDKVVSVPRMQDYYSQISTPKDKKRKVVFENGRHVMTSHVIPSEARERLVAETYKFAEEVLGLEPKEN